MEAAVIGRMKDTLLWPAVLKDHGTLGCSLGRTPGCHCYELAAGKLASSTALQLLQQYFGFHNPSLYILSHREN
jgi:hypothetical protein